MYHLDNTSGVPEMPEPKDKQSISPRWFGESQDQGGISWPGADWFNTVQAELLNLLAAAGIQPEKKAFDQLSKAIPVLGEKQIRQDLGSRYGYTLLNECSDIEELRAVQMEYHGQKIKLRCWDEAQHASFVDVFYVYDANDLTSVDDGYRTVVNADGQRLKALFNGAVDLRVAGLRASGDNVGTTFNRVYNAELVRVLASSYALKMPTIKLPALTAFGDPDSTTEFNAKLNASIKIPSFVPVECDGNYVCEFSDINAHAIWITNQIPGVVPDLTQWRNMQTVTMFANKSGRFRLSGPGKNVSQAAGVKLGNTASGDDILDVRDLTIEKVTVKNFRYGLDFDWHDTYIIKIKGVELSNNYWNVSSRLPAKENAGENIVISDALLSESASHCVYWNAPGIKVAIESSSLDYNNGAMLFLANGARGNAFKYAKCHIEGFGGMLVHQEAQAVAWFGKPNRVIFDEHSEIIAAGNTPGVWSPRRKILHSGAVLDKLGSMVEIRCPIFWPSPPSEPHIALMGYTDPTPQYMQAIYVCPMSPEPDCLVSYDQSANKGLYKFSGTEGASVKNSVDGATGYTFSTNGNPTIVYGQIDSDFLQHVIINFSAETEWVELRNKGLFYALEANAEINTGISVMMEALQSGTLTLNTRFNHFHGSDKTSAGYEDGPVFNVSELIGAVYNGIISPLTTSKYVGVQSAMRFTRRDLGFPTRAEYIQPGIVLRGVKGQVRIKLPVIWPTRGRGSCTVIS